MDFWNWHDTMFLVKDHFFPWILGAFVIGCIVGWMTCDTSRRTN